MFASEQTLLQKRPIVQEIKDSEKTQNPWGFEIKDENDRKFSLLCNLVHTCGIMAFDKQKAIHTSLKKDGTPVTETDLAISEILDSFISQNWPLCSRVSEEIGENAIKKDAPFTFVFDPIDGTDSYSQGLPCWCTGVGVFDSDRKPCAAVVFAPRMGLGEDELFICTTFNDDKVYLNGKEISAPSHRSIPYHITTGSNSFQHLDFNAYKGKIRALGSSLLHILGPCLWHNTDLCITPNCYIWDICSSHVIASKLGFVSKYIDKGNFEYTDEMIFERKPSHCSVVIGSKNCVDWALENIMERKI